MNTYTAYEIIEAARAHLEAGNDALRARVADLERELDDARIIRQHVEVVDAQRQLAEARARAARWLSADAARKVIEAARQAEALIDRLEDEQMRTTPEGQALRAALAAYDAAANGE